MFLTGELSAQYDHFLEFSMGFVEIGHHANFETVSGELGSFKFFCETRKLVVSYFDSCPIVLKLISSLVE